MHKHPNGERPLFGEYPLPFFDAPPPAKAPRDYATAEVARLGQALDRADGFVVLTAEYNHGYPAVLKNARLTAARKHEQR